MRVKLTAIVDTEPRVGISSMMVEALHTDGTDGSTEGHHIRDATTAELIRDVVEDSSSLALDDEGDREVLIERLVKALVEG